MTTKTINPLARFTALSTARNFAARTNMASAIILGDDNRYWVTTLREMEIAIAAGYEVVK